MLAVAVIADMCIVSQRFITIIIEKNGNFFSVEKRFSEKIVVFGLTTYQFYLDEGKSEGK